MCVRRFMSSVVLLLAVTACGRPEGKTLPPETWFVDDDFSAGEFGAGTCQGSAWIPDRGLTLGPGQQEGSFVSRILDAGRSVSWEYIAWVPLGHYGQALPDQGASETRGLGAVSMAENVLLLHLDGSDPVATGGKLTDGSGRGNDAIVSTASGSGSVGFAEGPFRQALADTLDTHAYVPLSARRDFDFRLSDFTWSLWVKTTQDCAGNKVYLGVEDGVAGQPHLWFGCYSSTAAYELCTECTSGGCAGGFFALKRGEEGQNARFCGKRAINDGAWHQMAVVKRGHDDAVVSLYVDGELEHEVTAHFADAIVFSSGPQLAIGAFSKGTYQSEASLDEVAIWRRALAAEEVRSLYLRGSLRLGFQVRGCLDATCSGDPAFVGPGDSPSALFADEMGGDHSRVQASLAGVSASRYLQYRLVLASRAPPETPVVSSVNVVPSP